MKRISLALNTGEGASPMYQQIEQGIIHAIEQKILLPNHSLPGTRELAADLGIDRTTVTKAYERLIAQGWVYAVPKKGTFVSDHRHPAADINMQKNGAVSTFSFNQYSQLETGADEPKDARYRLRFDPGFPDPNLAPIREVTAAYKRIFYQTVRLKKTDLSYAPIDHTKAVEELKNTLHRQEGLSVDVDHLCFIFGNQMAMYLVAQTLLKPGDAVAMEDPGDPQISSILKASNAEVHPIPVDEDGMVVDELERTTKLVRLKAVFVTPRSQFPTTASLSHERRNRLLQLSREHGIAVVELDNDREFVYDPEGLAPLISRSADDNVIYISNLSRMLPPLSFVSFVVGPPPFITSLKALWSFVGQQGDAILEQAVIDLMREGLLIRFARRSSNVYKQRRDQTAEIIDNYLYGKVHYQKPAAGLAFWLLFDHVDPGTIVQQLRAKGVDITDLRACYTDGSLLRGIRLGFASLPQDKIEEGIRELASLL